MGGESWSSGFGLECALYLSHTAGKNLKRLKVVVFFLNVRFGSHSVNPSYSKKPWEIVEGRELGDRKCPSVERTLSLCR